MSTLAQDLRETLLPAQDIHSATRLYTGPVYTPDPSAPATSDLVLVKQQRTGWQQAWDSFAEKVRGRCMHACIHMHGCACVHACFPHSPTGPPSPQTRGMQLQCRHSNIILWRLPPCLYHMNVTPIQARLWQHTANSRCACGPKRRCTASTCTARPGPTRCAHVWKPPRPRRGPGRGACMPQSPQSRSMHACAGKPVGLSAAHRGGLPLHSQCTPPTCCAGAGAGGAGAGVQMSGVPLVGKLASFRVSDTSAFKKGQEMVEDLKVGRGPRGRGGRGRHWGRARASQPGPGRGTGRGSGWRRAWGACMPAPHAARAHAGRWGLWMCLLVPTPLLLPCLHACMVTVYAFQLACIHLTEECHAGRCMLVAGTRRVCGMSKFATSSCGCRCRPRPPAHMSMQPAVLLAAPHLLLLLRAGQV